MYIVAVKHFYILCLYCCIKLCPYTSVYNLASYSLNLEHSMFHVNNPKSILRPQGMQMCRSKPFHVTWSKIYFMCLYSHFITILMTQRNQFINDAGLSASSSLTHLLQGHNNGTSDEYEWIRHSPYYSESQFKNIKNGLLILSLNIQNVFTKFDQFSLFIERVNDSNPISVICLNECWLNAESDISDINLPNYNMFIQRGARLGHGHCGLTTYVHQDYRVSELNPMQQHTAWDYMALEISHSMPNSTKYIINNVYRLPKYEVEDYSTFTEEFESFIVYLNTLKHTSFICGDFNLNLLLVNRNQHVGYFFENTLSRGYFPRITLPTRISLPSATLIDNIYSNGIINDIDKSGILVNDISDHKIIFTHIESNRHFEKVDKFIDIEVNDEISVQNFINELKDIHNKLSTNNSPRVNYELFSNLVKVAKEKHLPIKRVKYNKRKHKKSKWMTTALLNLINTKDRLYKIMIQSDWQDITFYNELKSQYKRYRAVLKKSIREAKRLYHIRMFNTFKNDIKKTWSFINNSLNRNKKKIILQSLM